MTYMCMLVHIGDDAAGERRVRLAAAIARRFDARLDGMYFAPAPLDVDPSELPPPEIATRLSQRAIQDRVEASFRSGAANAGVRNVDVCVVERSPIEEAIAAMRCADLSVLAHGGRSGPGGGFERQLAEQALLAAGSPIVFVPHAPATDVLADHVAIAWDGGREAARAVRDALPLLAQANRVTVLSFGARAKLGQDAGRSQARVAAYLATHEIRPDLREMVCTPSEAGELLLSQLADLGADLLVMGAYGHARVREIVLGGVTRTLLDSMTVPVLMSH